MKALVASIKPPRRALNPVRRLMRISKIDRLQLARSLACDESFQSGVSHDPEPDVRGDQVARGPQPHATLETAEATYPRPIHWSRSLFGAHETGDQQPFHQGLDIRTEPVGLDLVDLDELIDELGAR